MTTREIEQAAYAFDLIKFAEANSNNFWKKSYETAMALKHYEISAIERGLALGYPWEKIQDDLYFITAHKPKECSVNVRKYEIILRRYESSG